MKEVRILVSKEVNDSDDYYTQSIIVGAMSDWEKVDDDEFETLSRNLHRIPVAYGYKLMLVWKDNLKVAERVKSIKDLLRKEEEIRKKEAEERAAKKRLREEKKLKSSKEKELQLFKELESKYGKKS